MQQLQQYENKIRAFLIVTFSIVLLTSVYRDYKNYKDGYACDLRKRIVGARYMSKGLSPYFFKWTPNYPTTLCIQFEGDSTYKQNIVTLPPSYNWLLQPLSTLQFPVIEKVWFIFQYIALLSIFALFYFTTKNKTTQILLLISFVFLLLSKGWIRNIDIGQTYIVFPFLLSLMFILFRKHSKALFYYGLVVGLCIWLRPSYLFFTIPFLFAEHRILFFKGLFAMAIICLAQVFAFNQLHIWIDFLKSSSLWIQYYSARVFDNGAGFDHLIFPKTIEGQSNFSITPLPDYIANIPIDLRELFHIYFTNTFYTLAFISIATIITFSLFYKKKIQDQSVLLLSGFFIYYLSEIFMWLPKYSYYFVELFLPICLIMYNQQKVKKLPLTVVFIGLFLSSLSFKLLPMQLLLGEYIIIFGIFIHILLSLKNIPRDKQTTF